LLQQKNSSLADNQLKLHNQVSDLQAEVLRERKLRARLESSQQALIRHLHDMEAAVEAEKEQVGLFLILLPTGNFCRIVLPLFFSSIHFLI